MNISWIKLVQKRCRNTDKHASALLSLQIDFLVFYDVQRLDQLKKLFGSLSIEKHISVENRFIFDYWKTIFQSDCLHYFLSYQFNCLSSMFEKEKIRIYSEIKPGEKNFILCCIFFLFIISSLFQDFHFSNKMFVYMIEEHMPRFQRITWTGIVYQN